MSCTSDEVLDVAATCRDGDGELAVFVVNPLGQPQTRRLDLSGFGVLQGPLRIWTLAGPSLDAVNSFAEKTRVAPRESEQHALGVLLDHTFPAYSVTIMRCMPLATASGGPA